MKNNRKNRIKPKYVLIILGVFCIVGIGFCMFSQRTSGGTPVNVLLSPMQEGINSIGSLVADLARSHRSIAALESENEALNAEVDALQSRLTAMENNLSDYEALLEQLELSQKYISYEMTGARIIGKNPGNWYDTFTINKGSADGIKKDMNVIAGNGLVGIVTQVNVNSAVVRSIIDDTSSVSGMISKNLDICIVNGNLTLIDSGLLDVELISKDSTVVDGDEVVTSYISDKYLPGLLIGYISDITIDDSELTYNAKLTPVVDFQHLSNVLVIRQLKSELNATDENGISQKETGGDADRQETTETKESESET